MNGSEIEHKLLLIGRQFFAAGIQNCRNTGGMEMAKVEGIEVYGRRKRDLMC